MKTFTDQEIFDMRKKLNIPTDDFLRKIRQERLMCGTRFEHDFVDSFCTTCGSVESQI